MSSMKLHTAAMPSLIMVLLTTALVAVAAIAKPLPVTSSVTLPTTPTATPEVLSIITATIPNHVVGPTATPNIATGPDSNNSSTINSLPGSCSGRTMPNDNFYSMDEAIASFKRNCPDKIIG